VEYNFIYIHINPAQLHTKTSRLSKTSELDEQKESENSRAIFNHIFTKKALIRQNFCTRFVRFAKSKLKRFRYPNDKKSDF